MIINLLQLSVMFPVDRVVTESVLALVAIYLTLWLMGDAISRSEEQ